MRELRDDLREYIDRLAAMAEEEAARRMSARTGRRGPSCLLLVAACLAIVAVVAGVVVATQREDQTGDVVTGPDAEVAELSGTWTELPTTLAGPDSQTVLLRTDDAIITIHPENGGDDVSGEIFRPQDGTVEPIAPSGVEWRAFPAIVWTGTEVIVAGGSNGPGIDHAATAYSPASDSWRALPDPPGFVAGSDNQIGPAVWTGTEMISWASGLAFNPEAGVWRTIAEAPLSARADEAVTATDAGVFVWGGCEPQPDVQCDEVLTGDETIDGAIYDPANDTWTELPPSPLGAGDHPTAVWTGDEIIVTVNVPVDPAQPQVAAYDPARSSWRVLLDSPHPAGRYTVAVWTGELMVLHGRYGATGESGATTAFDPVGNEWFRLPDGPSRGPHTALALSPSSMIVAGGHPDSSPWLLEIAGQDGDGNRTIRGSLDDGRPFTRRHDPVHRLCLEIDGRNFGCDDVGPVLSADVDQTTTRFAIDADPPYETGLAYGYLPPGAVEVVAILEDGTRVDEGAVTGGTPRIWALALPAGVDALGSPPRVVYVDADGHETLAPAVD